jgi:cobalt-zinc-cadmium efflux system protein
MHTHDHSHNHGIPKKPGKVFALAVVLNLIYAAGEALFGVLNNSLALIADAGHNLTDVVGLGLGWLGIVAAQTRPTLERTYGLRKASILAALLSSLLIVAAMGIIAWEAIGRLSDPSVPPGKTIMIVAGVGILVNLATAMLFLRRKDAELNMKAAFLHMVADAAVSAGVVGAGLAVILTGWHWIDPTASLIIAGIIVWGTWDLLRESLNLAVDGVPRGIDIANIRTYLRGLPGVIGVHDLHVWGASTVETALTAHVEINKEADSEALLREASQGINDRFGVGHTTLQIEQESPCPTDQSCESEDETR